MTPAHTLIRIANLRQLPSPVRVSLQSLGQCQDHVACFRPWPLGNPYVLGRDGSRADVIQSFGEFLDDCLLDHHYGLHPGLTNPVDVLQAFDKLVHTFDNYRQLTLVCYCTPLPCHTEIIRNRLITSLQECGLWPDSLNP